MSKVTFFTLKRLLGCVFVYNMLFQTKEMISAVRTNTWIIDDSERMSLHLHAKNGKSLTFLIKPMMNNGKNCLKKIRPKFAIFHQPQVIYWLNSQIGVVTSFQKLGIIFRKKRISKLISSMSITKNVLLNWYSSMKKKKNEKDSYNFRHRKLIMKVEFWHFLTPPHYTISQNSITSFEYVDFEANIFLIVYPPLENSRTRITISVKARFASHSFTNSHLDHIY